MSEGDKHMQSKDPLRSKESIPLLWRNRFCWLPFIGALITLIPTILVILNLWQGLPKQKFPEIEELNAMAFFVGYLDARTFYHSLGAVFVLASLLLIISTLICAKRPKKLWYFIAMCSAPKFLESMAAHPAF